MFSVVCPVAAIPNSSRCPTLFVLRRTMFSRSHKELQIFSPVCASLRHLRCFLSAALANYSPSSSSWSVLLFDFLLLLERRRRRTFRRHLRRIGPSSSRRIPPKSFDAFRMLAERTSFPVSALFRLCGSLFGGRCGDIFFEFLYQIFLPSPKRSG